MLVLTGTAGSPYFSELTPHSFDESGAGSGLTHDNLTHWKSDDVPSHEPLDCSPISDCRACRAGLDTYTSSLDEPAALSFKNSLSEATRRGVR